MNAVTEEQLRKIIVEVLSRRVYLPNVTPESIEIKNVAPGFRLHFTVRLSKYFKVLPPAEVQKRVYEQTGKKAEGAFYFLFGSLVILDSRVRAHARIISVETSEIKRVGMGDADLSEEGLMKAFEQALVKLGIGLVA